MFKLFVALVLTFGVAEAVKCESPKHSSTSFSTNDAFFHYHTTVVAEFALQCANNVRDAPFYAVVNGKELSVAVSEETLHYQVSWSLPNDQAGSQTFDIQIYDEDTFEQYQKACFLAVDLMLLRRLSTCSRELHSFRLVKVDGFTPRLLSTIQLLRIEPQRRFAAFNQPEEKRDEKNRNNVKFRMTMSDEEKSNKMKEIERARTETRPEGLVAKLKFYIKRYWYIAIPVHMANCLTWFAGLYLAVRSGIDVIGLMESLHMPDFIVEKLKNTPPSAGHLVVTFVLYKIATPVRYAGTIAGIRIAFEFLRKFGWLRTAREVEYSVRSGYEALNKRRRSSAANLTARLKEVKRASRMSIVRALSKTMSTKINSLSGPSARHLIAVCQLTSTHDLDANFKVCAEMVERAKKRNCTMVFFPECFDYVGRNREETIKMAYSENSSYMKKFRDLAKSNGLWLSLGGFHNKVEGNDKLPLNSHLILDSNGETQTVYNKLHLFDLDIPGKVHLMESEFSRAGDRLVEPIGTPVGKLGLSICYDVRFPELALWNRYEGAEILSFPSAFTLNTGLAHWETLMRARAIETQCYVVAAAQTGKHNEKRTSYGHAIVVDPWGVVVAQCSDTVDMCFAEINLDYVKEVRTNQPVFAHRRSDLYSINYSTQRTKNESLKFENNEIPATTIFYRTALSFAFVNLKPTFWFLQFDRLNVFSTSQIRKLPTCLSPRKKVQRALEHKFDTKSTTICVQDGEAAGRTVKHVHIHIIPRTKNDFGENPDNLYKELEIEGDRRPQTIDEMNAEAAEYRELFETTD
ncbi:hypothetical protein M3Y98_00207700 [Aphelenchoides besseyi]|nr:hypothetical protein M3Y98_00207700 [Aphelenchoides besseyi]